MPTFQSQYLFLTRNNPGLECKELSVLEITIYYAHELNILSHNNPEYDQATKSYKKPVYPYLINV